VLTPLLQNHELGKNLLQSSTCKLLNCKNPRAEAKGTFKGSEYCARHHQGPLWDWLAGHS
jgi:hypothetical protein